MVKHKITKDKFKFLFIPFRKEDKILLSNLHLANFHAASKELKKLIYNKGYFWDGYN